MKPPLDTKEQSFLLQSIDLQHYKRRMRYMLSAAQSHQNEMQVTAEFELYYEWYLFKVNSSAT